MGGTPTTTLTRYRALQAQADEGVRGLLRLACSWLGFDQAIVFLVDHESDFQRFVALDPAADGVGLRPLGRFALLAQVPVVLEDLRDSPLADEQAVQVAGGPRAFGGLRLSTAEGRLLGSLCLLGGSTRPARAGDGAMLEQVGRQLERWLVIDGSLRELEAAHGGQLERLQLLEGLARAGRTVALVAVGPEGAMTWLNQGAEMLAGERSEALRGRALDELLRDEEGEGLWARLCRDGDLVDLAAILRRGGQGLPVAVTAGAVHAEDGAVTGYVLALRNRTHQRQVDQMQRELWASMNHELRTPLSVVTASLQMLDLQTRGDPEGHELVGMARTGAQRLGRLIEDVLALQTLARLDVPLRPERCEAARLLGEVIAAGAGRAAERGVTLGAVTASGGGPVVLADEGWARRACEALLDNALERSAPGGALRFEVREQPGQVRLCVIDESPPPPPLEPEALGAVAQAQGVRLALSVARAVAQHHGGQVSWEPAAPRGCAFFLALPSA